jgi:hypothetical protein
MQGCDYITAMSSRKQSIIKLTDAQRDQVKRDLDKEVTFVIIRLVGGSHMIADVSDAPDSADGRL